MHAEIYINVHFNKHLLHVNQMHKDRWFTGKKINGCACMDMSGLQLPYEMQHFIVA